MRRLWLAAVFSVLGLSSNSFALEYDFTIIDFPNTQLTQAQGINDKGQIVGNFGNALSFVYTDGKFSVFERPSILTDINNNGVIAGNYIPSPGSGQTAFIYDGQFTDLFPPFPNARSSAFGTNPGINDAGHVAGTYDIGGTDLGGYLFDGNNYTDVYLGFETMLEGINNQGQFVGSYRVGNGDGRGGGERRGFLSDGTDVVAINFPGAFSTEPHSLNDEGVVAGFYTTEPLFPANGFVYDGEYHAVDVPFENSFATAIFGINNSGQLVGSFVDPAGVHGFLATPVRGAAVPEPSEFILFGMALAGIGGAYYLSSRKTSKIGRSIA